MTVKRLRDVDSAELAHRLRVFVWLGCSAFIMLAAAEFKLFGFGPKFLLLLALNVPFLAGVGGLLLWMVNRAARGWVNTVSGAGNIAPAASFSFQESLIIRGLYTEAADSFRAHLDHYFLYPKSESRYQCLRGNPYTLRNLCRPACNLSFNGSLYEEAVSKHPYETKNTLACCGIWHSSSDVCWMAYVLADSTPGTNAPTDRDSYQCKGRHGKTVNGRCQPV